MYTIYVLVSLKDGNLYIGCTSDFNKRILEHENGGVTSTRYRRPLKLVYSEQYEDMYEAFRKERYYKTAKGKKEIKQKFTYSGIV